MRRELIGVLTAVLLLGALVASVVCAPSERAAAGRASAPATAMTGTVGSARPDAAPGPALEPRAVGPVTAPPAILAPAPRAAGPARAPAPATVEEALGRELGLDPAQTERVAEVVRAAEAELREEMIALAERGYDDVAARRLGERFEEALLDRVEAALPPASRPRFRELMEEERRLIEDR